MSVAGSFYGGMFHPYRNSEDYNEFLSGDFDTPQERQERRLKNYEKAVENWQKAELRSIENDLLDHEGTGKQTLTQFVRANGGIKLEKGSYGYGELKDLSFKESGKKGIAHPKGKYTLDYMREAAAERGFISNNADAFDFVDLLQKDMSGQHQYGGTKTNPDKLQQSFEEMLKTSLKFQERAKIGKPYGDHLNAAAKKGLCKVEKKDGILYAVRNPATVKDQAKVNPKFNIRVVLTDDNAGLILDETTSGECLINWENGEVSVENKKDLLFENGLKSWYLRGRATSAYKKSLKAKTALKRAAKRQKDFELKLSKNPAAKTFWKSQADKLTKLYETARKAKDTVFAKRIKSVLDRATNWTTATTATKRNPAFPASLLANFANAAVGIHSAIEISKSVKKRNTPKPKTKPAPQKRKTTKPTEKAKKNPLFPTPSAFEEFRGRPPEKTLILEFPDRKPKTENWTLGKLLYVKYRSTTGRIKTLDFRSDVNGGKSWLLTADDKNVQMWIAGKPIGVPCIGGQDEIFGEVLDIVYRADKPHLGDYDETNYIHALGEEGGKRPLLVLAPCGRAWFSGGDYKIKWDGIHD